MKPGTGPAQRESAKEFASRISKEMRDEANRLEARAQRAQEKAEKLKKSAAALTNGK